MSDLRKQHLKRHATTRIPPLAVALLIALSFLAGCGKKAAPKEGAAEEGEPATPVTAEPVLRGAIDHVVVADAVLYPVNQSNVTPKISAPVKRILVSRGEHVKVGQVLAELESADLAAALEESKHQVDQAQAAYQLLAGATSRDDQSKAQADIQTAQQTFDAAKKVYDARAALQKEGALPQKMVDDSKLAMVLAQTQLEAAQRHMESLSQVGQREALQGADAAVRAAKAHYDSLNIQLSYGIVKSPLAGVVADRSVYPGEMAQPGMPLISIVDISSLIARANVPVKDAVTIKPGRPARIAGPDGDLAGTVTVVSPAVDPSTTTVEVWVKVDNPGEKLKPGGTVRVSIIAETITDTIVIPTSALLNFDEGGQKVMLVVGKGKNAVAMERKVVPGVRQGPRVQITSGLQEGDQVITSGGLGLEDKAKVEVQAPKSDDDDDDDAK
jgi:RND family efflux transporter MFP subunit